MMDIKLIRETPEIIRKDLEKRDVPEMIHKLERAQELDKLWRDNLQAVEKLKHSRNTLSKEISELKKQGKDAEEKLRLVRDIPAKIKEVEEQIDSYRDELDSILMIMPNILHDSVPVGVDDTQNKIERKVGDIPKFSFQPISHVDWIAKTDTADIERASKVSGARFYYLKNQLVMLDFALQKFGLDMMHKKGYTLMYPPFMMRKEPYMGVTDMEAFEDVLYKIEGEDLYLIATSEHPIGAYHMDEVIDNLPLKYAGISTCFRKEAGSHGKDTKGIFRVHQFNKIEQFIFCKPEESWDLHEELISNAEEIFKALKIPYRIVNVCTGDIGSIAAKKYDLEVWMPVQGKYREAVSCSNCTDYQARRLNVKYVDNNRREFVHTLNSTAIATGRAMVAIIENFQNEDGSVDIPEVLWPYMNGIKKIG